MKTSLLLCLSLFGATLTAAAHQVDPWTIFFDPEEMFDQEGKVAPDDSADYYLHTSNNNAYYPLTRIEGTNPAEYSGFMPVLVGNFKVYARGYWTSGASGNDRNVYIYGAADGSASIVENQYKTLAHPGQDMQIEGGGTWYAVQIRFFPDGTSANRAPQLVMSSGSHTPALAIDAIGYADGTTTGHVDFTVKPGGVLDSKNQTYEVTLTYTPYNGSTPLSPVTLTKTLENGYSGTFEDITNLRKGSSNKMDLTVTATDVATVSSPEARVATGRQTLTASTSCDITTWGSVYLVGDIKGSEWDPVNAIEGVSFNEHDPIDASKEYAGVMCWYDVPLQKTYRFAFVTVRGDWDTVNAHIRYSAKEKTVYCKDLTDNSAGLDPFTGNWYQAIVKTGSSQNSWAPAIAPDNEDRSTDAPDPADVYYKIFLDQKTNEVAIGWQRTPTAIAAIMDNPQPENDIVNVYNLQGAIVRSHVATSNATAGLPAGIYIVGHKKIAVR